MIADPLLTWALVATSLFNTILLLWLAITLWLNANRRNLHIAITAVGFVLGSAFFVSHSALLLSNTWRLTRGNTLWLALGMTPVVLLPYVWYVVLLWYNGYWTGGAVPAAQRSGAGADSHLRRRHRRWLWWASGVLLAGFACLVLLGIPYVPLLRQVTPWIVPARQFIKTPVLGVPLVAVGYPLYVLLCVLLSLDSLWRPGLTERMLGEEARRRARPWLMTATLLLLLVGFLVAVVVPFAVINTRTGSYYPLTRERVEVIARFDLALCLLIAAVTVLLGQAITAYELFTGKVLPRRGLARQWKRAVWLAAGYGLLIGGALARGQEPVYAALLTALLMTAFFALLSWRSYVEWEQAIRQLRPFVASQRWYDALVASPAAEHPPDPFHALCENLLNTSVAYLLPVGPTAALLPPQSYPAGSPANAPAVGPLTQQAAEEGRLILPLEPAAYGGATWAVPLWRERGLVGFLLFGPRRDDGLYTQEEIEIARSTGERLLDTAASLALSQRLMQLQRERMATTQILDQRTRRVLHDEVLPLIHTAMLALAAGQPAEAALQQLSETHAQVSDLLRELPPTVTPEIARLGLLGALRKAVEVEFAPAFAGVAWHSEEGVEAQAARLSPLAAETVYFAARELVRNAAKHARPAAAHCRPPTAYCQPPAPAGPPTPRWVQQGAPSKGWRDADAESREQAAGPESPRRGGADGCQLPTASSSRRSPGGAYRQPPAAEGPPTPHPAAAAGAPTPHPAAAAGAPTPHPAGQSGSLRLQITARVADGQLLITVEDNGAGLQEDTASGHGLALHSTLMAVVGGSLSLDTVPGQGTRAQLTLPLPE